MPRNPGLWVGIPLGFSDGAKAWHKSRERFGCGQSQRDCGLQPKVGAAPTLGAFENGNNANGVVASSARFRPDGAGDPALLNRFQLFYKCIQFSEAHLANTLH